MLKLEDIYDVTVAKDGQEALDLVKETMEPGTPESPAEDRKPFNLIFMDVQMPNVDGLESTRLIRQLGYHAPIVAITAFAEESNIQDCMDSGMNYFLSKPIRRPQLKKVLKEYCAPIPEENEEAAEEPPAPRPKSQGQSMIIVNSPVAEGASVSGHSREQTGSGSSNTQHTNGERDRPISPLSPLSKNS